MKARAWSAGSGPALVMLHGWGLHSGIWTTLLPRLQERFRVTCIDLPGHGESRATGGDFDLDSLTGAVLAAAPRQAAWLGWSLGGQVALAAAGAQRERVTGLVLVATTPRFLSGPGWPCGLPREVLEEFSEGLAADYRKMVSDFLTLQVRGDGHAAAVLKALRQIVFSRGEPDPVALRSGLAVLANTDLRPGLPRLFQPALVLSGQRDRLTPPEAGRRMAGALPAGRFHMSAGASHAPFLSHPGEFIEEVTDFLEELA